MKITVAQTGPLGTNTYIVANETTNECFIIDPAECERVAGIVEANNLSCCGILLTHGHFDHLMGVCGLKKRFNTQVYVHKNDARALQSDKYSLAAFVNTSVEKTEPDYTLDDNDVLNLAGFEIKVMHTPGHSPGSVCYIVESERVIFSGDTLFRLSVGRTDLLGSSGEELAFSLLYKLYMLHGDYKVFPGHGENTTLEFEKANNPVTRTMNYE